jgi:glycosyl transferase, family 25
MNVKKMTIPKIYLINLARDTIRLASMQAQFDAVGLTFTRIEAVLGHDMPEPIKPYFDLEKGEMSKGEVGCYASHLLVLKMIVESGIPAIIMEDDAFITPNFINITTQIPQIKTAFDIIRLSNPAKTAVIALEKFDKTHDLVSYLRTPYTTTAYYITPEGAKKFLKQQIRTLPIDVDLRFYNEWCLKSYGIIPAPVGVTSHAQLSVIDTLSGTHVFREPVKRNYANNLTRNMKTIYQEYGFTVTLKLVFLNSINSFLKQVFKVKRLPLKVLHYGNSSRHSS